MLARRANHAQIRCPLHEASIAKRDSSVRRKHARRFLRPAGFLLELVRCPSARSRAMRLRLAVSFAALAFAFTLTAAAQKPPPANLEPLPEAAPPPPEIANDPELTPQVTVI